MNEELEQVVYTIVGGLTILLGHIGQLLIFQEGISETSREKLYRVKVLLGEIVEDLRDYGDPENN